MFAIRIKWFAIVMTLLGFVIVGRLAHLQLLRQEFYESIADRLLTRPVRYLAAPRGAIRDRNGALLVQDAPTSSVAVLYDVLTVIATGESSKAAEQYLRAAGRQLVRGGVYPPDLAPEALVARVRADVDESWRQLLRFGSDSAEDVLARARGTVNRVELVRQRVAAAGVFQRVREETWYHPVIDGLDADLAVQARLELERYPWISISPSAARVVEDGESLVHLLGRLGAASPDRIAESSVRFDDELRQLHSGDLCGISGVEYLAEDLLRGTRGRLVEDFDREVIERTQARPGSDVYLAIDAALQRKVYDALREAVISSDHPAGGSAVVIEARTREVLALVSFPGYSYEEFDRDYARLRADTRYQPLRFRAVANQYPPGSTGKVAALYGAFAEGVAAPNTTFVCDGPFRKNIPNAFRCWYFNRYGASHGPQNATDAIAHSCNIYFYSIGDRLGPERLCTWFMALGLGRTQGTGLIEESTAIVPTPEWMRTVAQREYQPADAWNFAIGQGELTATPLQCANVAASIASGRWAPVRLARTAEFRWLGEASTAPAQLNDAYLRPIRDGMWRVVNESGGTARLARLEARGHVLCGKTGSAQTVSRVLDRRYTFRLPDGSRREIVALSSDEAADRLAMPDAELIGAHANRRFPPMAEGERLPSHAWFIGFTQADSTPRGAAPRGRVYALSVIIEFGGSGGMEAGPVAKKIAELALATVPVHDSEIEHNPTRR